MQRTSLLTAKNRLTLSARSQQSEHQTGLCMDLTCESMGMDLQESFADTAEGSGLPIMPRIMFIIRFPEGKTDITGYSYELGISAMWVWTRQKRYTAKMKPLRNI